MCASAACADRRRHRQENADGRVMPASQISCRLLSAAWGIIIFSKTAPPHFRRDVSASAASLAVLLFMLFYYGAPYQNPLGQSCPLPSRPPCCSFFRHRSFLPSAPLSPPVGPFPSSLLLPLPRGDQISLSHEATTRGLRRYREHEHHARPDPATHYLSICSVEVTRFPCHFETKIIGYTKVCYSPCRCDGIGETPGFKIRVRRNCAGSTPPPAQNKVPVLAGIALVPLYYKGKIRLKNVIAYLSKFKRITVKNEQIRKLCTQIPVTGAQCAPYNMQKKASAHCHQRTRRRGAHCTPTFFQAESAFAPQFGQLIIVVLNKDCTADLTRSYTLRPSHFPCIKELAQTSFQMISFAFFCSEAASASAPVFASLAKATAIHRVTRFPPDPSRECRDAPPGWKRRSACAFCRTDAVG